MNKKRNIICFFIIFIILSIIFGSLYLKNAWAYEQNQDGSISNNNTTSSASPEKVIMYAEDIYKRLCGSSVPYDDAGGKSSKDIYENAPNISGIDCSAFVSSVLWKVGYEVFSIQNSTYVMRDNCVNGTYYEYGLEIYYNDNGTTKKYDGSDFVNDPSLNNGNDFLQPGDVIVRYGCGDGVHHTQIFYKKDGENLLFLDCGSEGGSKGNWQNPSKWDGVTRNIWESGSYLIRVPDDGETGDFPGIKVEEIIYEIRTIDDFLNIGNVQVYPFSGIMPDQVVKGQTGQKVSHITYKLMNDIDFAGEKIKPISYNLNGTLDGNGHYIKNIVIDTSEASDEKVGEFGIFKSISNPYVQIQDLHIDNVSIVLEKTLKSQNYVGVLAGKFSGNSVIGVTVSGNIICGDNKIGGLFGAVTDTEIPYIDKNRVYKNENIVINVENCISHINVYSSGIVGGVFEEVNINGNFISKVNISNCQSLGKLNGKEVGGIISELNQEYGEINIKDCKNIGNIKATDISAGIIKKIRVNSIAQIESCENDSDVLGKRQVAGIVYDIDLKKEGEIFINNSVNNGSIQGGNESLASGIIGCVNNGKKIEVSNCNNLGNLNSRVGKIAGIVGKVNKADIFTINNCENKGELTGGNHEKDIAGIAVQICSIKKVKIEKCSNYAFIVNNGRTGGIVSEIGNCENIDIIRCSNVGNIVSRNDSGEYVAGIIAYVYNNTTGSLNIENCENTASIIGGAYISGIIGKIEGFDSVNLVDLTNDKEIISNSSANKLFKVVYGVSGVIGDINSNIVSLNNCNNYATIYFEEGFYIGGICGKLNSNVLNIEQCNQYGDIYGNNAYWLGGIVGMCRVNNGVIDNSAVIKDCKKIGIMKIESDNEKVVNFMGGIAGNLEGVRLEKCSNDNIIEYDGGNYIGGIAGKCYESIIIDCINNGNVIWTKKINSISNGAGKIGGIVGYSSNNISIENCTNNSEINGKEEIGGIVGFVAKNGKVINCNNKGNVNGDKKEGYRIGGIAGGIGSYIQLNGTLSNYGNVTGPNGSTGAICGLIGDYKNDKDTPISATLKNLGTIVTSQEIVYQRENYNNLFWYSKK